MKLSDIQQKISPILCSFGVTYAAVFGSVSRGQDRSDSDIDLLIRLGKPMGMFSFMNMINTLEETLGRRVDVLTEKGLNENLKPYIMPDLKVIYEGR